MSRFFFNSKADIPKKLAQAELEKTKTDFSSW
jgi:hypothetical protein